MRASAQPTPNDEAEVRAQRIAGRVLEVIRNASKAEPPRPATPTRTEPPPRNAPKPPIQKLAPRHVESAPAELPLSNSPVALESPAAAIAAVALEPVSVQGNRSGAVSLFDFEGSAPGFTLHARSNWALMPSQHITLTDQAQQGGHALAIQPPQPAWLGVDLEEAVDFTELRSISYWLRTDQPNTPPFAIKTGAQYDWCRLTVTTKETMATPSGTFVRYEADVKTAREVCRYVDLSDVRGFFWALAANSHVVLDNVELR